MIPRKKAPPLAVFLAWMCLVPFLPQDLGFQLTLPRDALHHRCKSSWGLSTHHPVFRFHAVRSMQMFEAAKSSPTTTSPLSPPLLSWRNRGGLVKPNSAALCLRGSPEGETRVHEKGRQRRQNYTVKDDPAFPFKFDMEDGRYVHIFFF